MLYTMLAVAMLGPSATLPAEPPGVLPAHAARISRFVASRHADRPGIRVWATGDDVYRRGERARIYFRTERDAFVTIFRIDTDGRVRVLYPTDPWDDNFVRGGASYQISNYRRGEAFLVDDDPGVGYVFGIAASDPFNYGPIAGREHWEVYRVAERIHADPFAGAMDIVDHLLPPDYADYDTHLLPYYVERRYNYPRFVCYDCHSYIGYSYWNPYAYSCSRFSLWVYNDPFYYYPSYWYPTRYYGGTRVVYARPRGTAYVGRFVFKNRSQADPPIQYRRRTDVASATPEERGVRGRDIGGVGSVGVPGRRTVEPGTNPTNPPVIRGETGGGRRQTDQPADRPGNQPPDDRRGLDRRNDEPAGRPRDERGEPPGRPGDDRRNDEPGGRPRDDNRGGGVGRQDIKPDVRDINRPARQEPQDADPVRRGVYRQPEREPADRNTRPTMDPRAAEPRREAAPPRSEPRQAEPRQAEPRRAEPPREAAPPPRSEPRSEPRSQPQSQPRAEPRRESSPPPRSEPAPRLERRRPDSER